MNSIGNVGKKTLISLTIPIFFELLLVTVVGNIDTIGIRNNKYSTVSGLIKGINDKLESRDKEYTMIDLDNDASGQNKLSINDSSVLNKVFGYFFDN